MRDNIVKWNNLTNEITDQWIRDYFQIEENEEIDFYWVADKVGTVFSFADYYFDFNTVLECYRLDISIEQLFSWYNFCLDNRYVNISLAKYIISPQERKEEDKRYIQELNERINLLKKEFNKVLEKL